MKNNTFQFSATLPIARAYEESVDGVEKYYITGIASGIAVDNHNDQMAVSAIHAMAEFIKNGTIVKGKQSFIPLRNQHQFGVHARIGWVVDAEVDDEKNLWITAELDNDSSPAMDLYKQLSRGDLPNKPAQFGLSVGATVTKYSREWNTDKNQIVRVFKELKLNEVSVVEEGAYEASFVDVIRKSIEQFEQEHPMENEKSTNVSVVFPAEFGQQFADLATSIQALVQQNVDIMKAREEAPAPITIEEVTSAQEEIVKSAVAAAIEEMKTEVVTPLQDEITALKAKVEEYAAQPVDKSMAIQKSREELPAKTIQEEYVEALKSNTYRSPIHAAVAKAGVSDTAKKILSS